jgi:hypothetical protein
MFIGVRYVVACDAQKCITGSPQAWLVVQLHVLLLACRDGHLDIVQYLVTEAGVDAATVRAQVRLHHFLTSSIGSDGA